MKTQNSFLTATSLNTLARRFRTVCAARLLPLLLLLALPAAMQAQDYTYTTNNDTTTITITGYIGSGGDVAVPNTIDGFSVSGIGSFAFYKCISLTSVTIPNSVTSVANVAFADCTSLTNVNIGTNLTSIAGDTFAHCISLTAIAVDPLNSFFSSLDGVLFNKSQTELVIYPGGKTGSYTIPNSVTCLGDDAFINCVSLTSVTIPNSVINIGAYTFAWCWELTNATIGNSVTNIGDCAFGGCALRGVYFQGNAPSLGSDVFSGDGNATVYCLPGTTGWGSTFGGRTTILLPYTYTTINGTISITGYTGSGGLVIIPNSMNGLPITSIGNDAFAGCTNLTDVTIPDSITNIGDYAFADCFNLIIALIPDSVTSIENNAFADCTSLEGVYFYGNAPDVGLEVFDNDTNATAYFLPETAGWGSTFGGLPTTPWIQYIYSTNNGTITIDCYYGSASAVTIPNTINGLPVTGIGGYAFYYCTNLTSVTIPNSVTNIGYLPFYYCSRLTGLYFQGNAPGLDRELLGGSYNTIIYYMPGTIGWDAPTFGGLPTAPWPFPDFLYMDNNGTITVTGYTGSGGDVTIPETINGLPVTGIGGYAFCFCSRLTSVTIPDCVTSMGDAAFNTCTSLTSVVIGNSVTSIGYEAFFDCFSLTSVTIGTNVTSIGFAAFADTSLTNVKIPNSVTSIGDEAFTSCTSLTNVTIGTNVTSIEELAFYRCISLTNVMIPNSVTNIGEGPFDSCTSLTVITVDTNNAVFCSMNGVLFDKSQTTLVEYPSGLVGSYTIPESVTNIWACAFSGCGSLTSVTIPGSVTSIGSMAFYGCYSLTNVTIPDSVTSIGSYAFQDCTSLTSVTIGNSVTSIGDRAFYNCTGLAGIYFQGNAPSIGLYVFYYDDNAIVYYLPGTTGWAPPFGGLQTTMLIQFTYTTNDDNTITITGYTGSGGDVILPDTINGLPVTSIGSFAFCNCNSLNSFTISDSVTNVGFGAFFFCTGLTNVIVGNGTASIGNAAFAYCTSLNNVTIGSSVNTIGDFAFYNCTNLTGIYFQWNAPTIGLSVFDHDNNATVYYLPGTTGWDAPTFGGLPAAPGFPPVPVPYIYTTNDDNTITITGYTGSGGNVAIPDTIDGLSVSSIGDYAFYWCISVINITIPDSVTNIGVSAFDTCTKLTSITIGNSVTSIGGSAFSECTSLASITIPNSVINIGDYVFDACASLSSVMIGNSVTSIGDWAFFTCGCLTNVTIPDSVTSIGVSAFDTCTSLTSITIGNGATNIGDYAFEYSGLTNVTIGDNVTSIGGYAFYSCTSLTAITVVEFNPVYSSVDGVLFNMSTNTLIQCPEGKAGSYTVPNSVTNIGDYAFFSCASLSSVMIGNGVTSIGSYAFEYSGLTNVTIGNSVTSIGDYAFFWCTSLTSVMVGNSVTSIGVSAFDTCTSLTSVTIPNSVTSIGISAFSDCFSLTSVTVGNGVTDIGDWAFYSCSLTSVYFKGNAPSIGLDVFYGDNNVTVYYLPGATGWDAPTFGGRPTALWTPQMQTSDASFGVRTNQFGFNINWASGQVVVVEASTDLANPTWVPLQTNTLTADSCYFSDPDWTNYPGRFYRLRSP